MNRAALRSLLAGVTLGVMATGAPAQDYPNKPITIMVGLAAGGITDVTARLYAEAVAKITGQRITVENRTGAGGGVAAAAVQNARARRSYAAGVLRLAARHRAGGRHRDLRAGERLLADHVSVQQRGGAHRAGRQPGNTMKELHEWGRKKQGGLTFGTPGLGSPSHLLGAKS